MAIPEKYTQLSYIESTGTQYIDTGILPQIGLKIVIDVKYTSADNDTWICGAVRDWTTGIEAGIVSNALYMSLGFSYSPSDSSQRMTITGQCTTSNHVTDLPIYLFSRNTHIGANNGAACRIYSARFYLNDTLIADYVPCVSDSGVYGMYDTVSQTFNAGTGGFGQGWQIIDGVLTNTNAPQLPESYMTQPYPSSLWRIDSTANNGFPYHELMIDVLKINLYFEKTKPMIHVYSSTETDFSHNGLAIIEPTECEVRHEENGLYNVEMSLIVDDEGKHQYIKKFSQFRVPIKYHGEISEQIFFATEVIRQMNNSGLCTVCVSLKHIFYRLNNYVYYNKSFTNLNGKEALNTIVSHYGTYGESANDIPFSVSSDITDNRSAAYHDINITSALLGADNCFVNLYGGKLYRDNFYFSINREMENHKTSGVISYGYNMTEIEYTEDVSGCVTWLRAYDNFGNSKIIEKSGIPNADFPHHIYKVVQFSYAENNKEQFERDAEKYFEEYSVPKINIKVRFAELTDYELYKDFLDLADFEVGDKIIIYHKDLDINIGNLEIISKTYDVVNGKTVDIEIGSFKNATFRSAFMSGVVGADSTAKQLEAVQSQIDNIAFDTYIQTPITTVDGKYLTTADGKYLIYTKE